MTSTSKRWFGAFLICLTFSSSVICDSFTDDTWNSTIEEERGLLNDEANSTDYVTWNSTRQQDGRLLNEEENSSDVDSLNATRQQDGGLRDKDAESTDEDDTWNWQEEVGQRDDEANSTENSTREEDGELRDDKANYTENATGQEKNGLRDNEENSADVDTWNFTRQEQGDAEAKSTDRQLEIFLTKLSEDISALKSSQSIWSDKSKTTCPEHHIVPCVPKCCAVFEEIVTNSSNTPKCLPIGDDEDNFFPQFADISNINASTTRREDRYMYIKGDPCKSGKYRLEPDQDENDKYLLYSNGTLFTSKRLLTTSEFCVETVNGEIFVFTCFETGLSAQFPPTLYPVFLLMSVPFLLLTAFKSNPKTIEGRSLIGFFICLAVAYSFLGTVQFLGNKPNPDMCVASASIIQFSFFSCFCWLNVLCYHSYSNLNKTMPVMSLWAFLLHCLQLPGILLLFSWLMGVLDPPSCSFYNETVAQPYFCVPVGIFLVVNVFFFVLSAITICREKQPTKIEEFIKQVDNCYWLSLLMGCNWSLVFISRAVGWSDNIWKITDILNALQAAIIYFIYRCRCDEHPTVEEQSDQPGGLVELCAIGSGSPRAVTPEPEEEDVARSDQPCLEKSL